MTARHQVRVGGRVAHDRMPIDATPAPSLGETLQVARERKGVDLHRAERDTKIRFRHLAALENDDYAELPGNVYARGFLRNYALYLGLDPEEMLVKWRHEQDLRHLADQEAIVAPPQPITEPKGHLRFSRSLLAAALLVVAIAAFGGYLALQLVRFSEVPAVAFDGPPRRELPADAQSAHLTGSSTTGFTIVVTGPGDFLKTVQTGEDTKWSIDVPVTKGRNDFTILARDPGTNRDSSPVNLIVMVPVPAAPTSAASTSAPATTPAGILLRPARLTIGQPIDGSRINSSAVKVSGTTEAASVSVTAVYVGPVGRTVPAPLPAGSTPRPVAPGGPAAPSVIEVGVNAGAFSASLALAVGRWTITATTAATGSLASSSQSRTVEVSYGGMVLVVKAHGGSARIQVWADGAVVEAGKILHKGDSETFTASQTIVVHTGNAGATVYKFNGVDIGTRGKAGARQKWQFDKGKSQPHRI